MDAAREYTDREIRRISRELAMEYGREGELAASKVLDFLTERAVDGAVPESALQGRDWARLRSEVARRMSDRNRESVMGLYGDLTKVRDLTAGDAEPRSRMPEPSMNRRRDLTWNERHVEAAARAAVGKDPSVAAKGVRGLADMNRNAAVRKARTAINGAENAGRMDAMLARGGSKRWVAVMDERTRVSHASINGEVVPVEEPFSNGLMYPGDPSGPPEEVYNCRCTMEWVDTAKSGEGGALTVPEEVRERVDRDMASDDWFEYENAQWMRDYVRDGTASPVDMNQMKVSLERRQELAAEAELMQAEAAKTKTRYRTLYRGMVMDPDEARETFTPGDQYVFDTLTSTAKDPGVASIYTNVENSAVEGGVPVVMTIQKGDGIYGFDRDGMEVVLPKGSEFRVVKNWMDRDGTIHVELYAKARKKNVRK